MTRVYYREAVGAFVVFDVTRTPTFEAVKKWKADIDHKVFLSDEKPIPCVLLCNKVDLKESIQSYKTKQDLDNFIQENGFVGWFETSAKDNVGIDEAGKFLIEKIMSLCVDKKTDEDAKRDIIKELGSVSRPQENGYCCKY